MTSTSRRPLQLEPDRLFPADPSTRGVARALYREIADLPIVSPHGHTDAGWFASNEPWSDATSLLLAPDHYIFRLLYSHGITLDALHIPGRHGTADTDPRAAWQLFAAHYYLFRGTPSRLWLDHVFADVFGLNVALDAATADHYFDVIGERLASDAFRPRALFDRFRIELLATTEGPQDDLAGHHAIRASAWGGADLSQRECESLFGRIVGGSWTSADAELFRAQMLTEMARMSLDDGMVMQIHPGTFRNHNSSLFASHGPDKGADIPMRTDYVHALKPLLDRFGTRSDLTIILFTLDESNYARELAPLAGHYPCLKLGPAWWFHDSPEGMRRFREMTTETAGFYNTVGFNDDTRAFLSIPARHDVARRVDCGFLARLVAEHRIEDWEAAQLAQDLTYNLAKRAYKL